MAMLVQNLLKKNADKVHSVPHFTINCPSWWNSTDQQVPQSLGNNISLKVESPRHLYHGSKHVGLQLPEQESSSTQSIGETQHEVGPTQGTNSQDQCMSSESGQVESCDKYVGGQSKPLFLSSNTEFVFNPSQVDYSYAMACVPYPYSDPYFGALVTSYEPHAIISAQMVGIAPGRVPLPIDHAADGPIYVNAKQYHGILRRRQLRAKLEAQNKIVKARKPYLHESRHRHALNRVRGSGGRFLGSKKLQQTSPTSTTHCASNPFMSPFETCSDITSVSTSNVSPHRPDIMHMVGTVKSASTVR